MKTKSVVLLTLIFTILTLDLVEEIRGKHTVEVRSRKKNGNGKRGKAIMPVEENKNPDPLGRTTGIGLNVEITEEAIEKQIQNIPSDFCKFGKPVPGKCNCSKSENEIPNQSICGSDLENYKNPCEFECAFKCNPRLNRYDGECPKNGGLPKRPRLNYTKKEKVHVETSDDNPDDGNGADYDGDDIPSQGYDPNAVSINRALIGFAMDEFSMRKK